MLAQHQHLRVQVRLPPLRLLQSLPQVVGLLRLFAEELQLPQLRLSFKQLLLQRRVRFFLLLQLLEQLRLFCVQQLHFGEELLLALLQRVGQLVFEQLFALLELPLVEFFQLLLSAFRPLQLSELVGYCGLARVHLQLQVCFGLLLLLDGVLQFHDPVLQLAHLVLQSLDQVIGRLRLQLLLVRGLLRLRRILREQSQRVRHDRLQCFLVFLRKLHQQADVVVRIRVHAHDYAQRNEVVYGGLVRYPQRAEVGLQLFHCWFGVAAILIVLIVREMGRIAKLISFG